MIIHMENDTFQDISKQRNPLQRTCNNVNNIKTEAGVLDEHFSQLTALSGIAPYTYRNPVYIGWNSVHPT